jgi:nucleotide-binding universal stress UspA family protein
MTLHSKTRLSKPSRYFETAAQVLNDDTKCRDEKENILRSMALDAEQMLEATVEGMPLDSPAYDAKDLQSALIQLEHIKGPDAPSSHDASFKRIMVVTTLDHEMNRTVTDTAFNLAKAAGGKVFLLAVVPSDFELSALAAAGPMVAAVPLVVTDETDLIEGRNKQLEALRDEMASRVDAEIEVRNGQLTQVIVEYADECAADVIVVGSPNRSWLDSLLNMSISRKVTMSAPCPVLVVPEAAEPA